MELSTYLPEAAPVAVRIPDELPEPVPAHAGYGACSVSGCHCQAYQGQDYTCTNCGHNYGLHW